MHAVCMRIHIRVRIRVKYPWVQYVYVSFTVCAMRLSLYVSMSVFVSIFLSVRSFFCGYVTVMHMICMCLRVCACVRKGEVNCTVPQDNTQRTTVRVQNTIKSKKQKAKTKQRSKKKITKEAKQQQQKRSSKQKGGTWQYSCTTERQKPNLPSTCF